MVKDKKNRERKIVNDEEVDVKKGKNFAYI